MMRAFITKTEGHKETLEVMDMSITLVAIIFHGLFRAVKVAKCLRTSHILFLILIFF